MNAILWLNKVLKNFLWMSLKQMKKLGMANRREKQRMTRSMIIWNCSILEYYLNLAHIRSQYMYKPVTSPPIDIYKAKLKVNPTYHELGIVQGYIDIWPWMKTQTYYQIIWKGCDIKVTQSIESKFTLHALNLDGIKNKLAFKSNQF